MSRCKRLVGLLKEPGQGSGVMAVRRPARLWIACGFMGRCGGAAVADMVAGAEGKALGARGAWHPKHLRPAHFGVGPPSRGLWLVRRAAVNVPATLILYLLLLSAVIFSGHLLRVSWNILSLPRGEGIVLSETRCSPHLQLRREREG